MDACDSCELPPYLQLSIAHYEQCLMKLRQADLQEKLFLATYQIELAQAKKLRDNLKSALRLCQAKNDENEDADKESTSFDDCEIPSTVVDAHKQFKQEEKHKENEMEKVLSPAMDRKEPGKVFVQDTLINKLEEQQLAFMKQQDNICKQLLECQESIKLLISKTDSSKTVKANRIWNDDMPLRNMGTQGSFSLQRTPLLQKSVLDMELSLYASAKTSSGTRNKENKCVTFQDDLSRSSAPVSPALSLNASYSSQFASGGTHRKVSLDKHGNGSQQKSSVKSVVNDTSIKTKINNEQGCPSDVYIEEMIPRPSESGSMNLQIERPKQSERHSLYLEPVIPSPSEHGSMKLQPESPKQSESGSICVQSEISNLSENHSIYLEPLVPKQSQIGQTDLQPDIPSTNHPKNNSLYLEAIPPKQTEKHTIAIAGDKEPSSDPQENQEVNEMSNNRTFSDDNHDLSCSDENKGESRGVVKRLKFDSRCTKPKTKRKRRKRICYYSPPRKKKYYDKMRSTVKPQDLTSISFTYQKFPSGKRPSRETTETHEQTIRKKMEMTASAITINSDLVPDDVLNTPKNQNQLKRKGVSRKRVTRSKEKVDHTDVLEPCKTLQTSRAMNNNKGENSTTDHTGLLKGRGSLEIHAKIMDGNKGENSTTTEAVNKKPSSDGKRTGKKKETMKRPITETSTSTTRGRPKRKCTTNSKIQAIDAKKNTRKKGDQQSSNDTDACKKDFEVINNNMVELDGDAVETQFEKSQENLAEVPRNAGLDESNVRGSKRTRSTKAGTEKAGKVVESLPRQDNERINETEKKPNRRGRLPKAGNNSSTTPNMDSNLCSRSLRRNESEVDSEVPSLQSEAEPEIIQVSPQITLNRKDLATKPRPSTGGLRLIQLTLGNITEEDVELSAAGSTLAVNVSKGNEQMQLEGTETANTKVSNAFKDKPNPMDENNDALRSSNEIKSKHNETEQHSDINKITDEFLANASQRFANQGLQSIITNHARGEPDTVNDCETTVLLPSEVQTEKSLLTQAQKGNVTECSSSTKEQQTTDQRKYPKRSRKQTRMSPIGRQSNSKKSMLKNTTHKKDTQRNQAGSDCEITVKLPSEVQSEKSFIAQVQNGNATECSPSNKEQQTMKRRKYPKRSGKQIRTSPVGRKSNSTQNISKNTTRKSGTERNQAGLASDVGFNNKSSKSDRRSLASTPSTGVSGRKSVLSITPSLKASLGRTATTKDAAEVSTISQANGTMNCSNASISTLRSSARLRSKSYNFNKESTVNATTISDTTQETVKENNKNMRKAQKEQRANQPKANKKDTLHKARNVEEKNVADSISADGKRTTRRRNLRGNVTASPSATSAAVVDNELVNDSNDTNTEIDLDDQHSGRKQGKGKRTSGANVTAKNMNTTNVIGTETSYTNKGKQGASAFGSSVEATIRRKGKRQCNKKTTRNQKAGSVSHHQTDYAKKGDEDSSVLVEKHSLVQTHDVVDKKASSEVTAKKGGAKNIIQVDDTGSSSAQNQEGIMGVQTGTENEGLPQSPSSVLETNETRQCELGPSEATTSEQNGQSIHQPSGKSRSSEMDQNDAIYGLTVDSREAAVVSSDTQTVGSSQPGAGSVSRSDSNEGNAVSGRCTTQGEVGLQNESSQKSQTSTGSTDDKDDQAAAVGTTEVNTQVPCEAANGENVTADKSIPKKRTTRKAQKGTGNENSKTDSTAIRRTTRKRQKDSQSNAGANGPAPEESSQLYTVNGNSTFGMKKRKALFNSKENSLMTSGFLGLQDTINATVGLSSRTNVSSMPPTLAKFLKSFVAPKLKRQGDKALSTSSAKHQGLRDPCPTGSTKSRGDKQ